MRKRWVAGLALLGGIWWLQRGGASSELYPAPATAVLGDGFAIMTQRPDEPHDVIELSRTGEQRHQVRLRRDGDVRFAGRLVGWEDENTKKLLIGVIDRDGDVGQVTRWGKKVRQLCEGVATNEHRFGIGWIEGDGRVWLVHGPAVSSVAPAPVAALEAPAKASWCGLASAGENIALLWRDGSRMLMNFCSSKDCSSHVVKVSIKSKETLVGYGCVRDACLFGTRDAKGVTSVYHVTETGRTIVKPLADAFDFGPISIVGAGNRAFAIAYVKRTGTSVQRYVIDGPPTELRQYYEQRWPVNLAWAGDRLLVARPDHRVETFALPR